MAVIHGGYCTNIALQPYFYNKFSKASEGIEFVHDTGKRIVQGRHGGESSVFLQKVITDSGYGSEENYGYLDGSRKLVYVKPANYQISKTRKKDISRAENMEYDEVVDTYTCHNGKILHKSHTN